MLQEIDEIQGIGLYLDIVLRKVQQAYLRTFKTLGVTMTIEQWVILHQVYAMGETASQRDIVQSNFRNRATISRVIGGLERNGWIAKTRFKGDQKRYRLTLTPQGKRLIVQVLPHAEELRKMAVEGLDTDEFAIFLKVLRQVGANYVPNPEK